MDAGERVKFLCSYGGSILPRPQDGKLRYVGGETRIVSLHRDVTYEDLMSKMRELFDGAWVLKYQQPEEDLDALVSVVDDDDVVNMMEEYDKLGAGKDGFTRLRIFLFPRLEMDAAGSLEADERETERRYVDALNSFRDGSHLGNEIQFNNLHQLKIPRVPSYGQRFSEIDGSWSPAGCYSPGLHTPREQHHDFPLTPPSARFPFGMDDVPINDRINDEPYIRHGQIYESHQSPSYFASGNVAWFPPGGVVVEKSGFPGNLGHTHTHPGGYDASGNVCEHCHMAIQRNHTVGGLDMRYPEHRHPFVEQFEFGGQFSHSCGECMREREIYLQEMKMEQGVYINEQIEQRSFYCDLHGHDRDWVLHHNQLNHRPNEMRGHRNVPYGMDGSGVNLPCNFGSSHSGPSMVPNVLDQDNTQYVRPTTDLRNEVFNDPHAVGSCPRIHPSQVEDSGLGLQYGGNTSAYGVDSTYKAQQGSSSIHALRKTHGSIVTSGPSHEASSATVQMNGAHNIGYGRIAQEGSPRITRVGPVGHENLLQNPWLGHVATPSQKNSPVNGVAVAEHQNDDSPKLNPEILISDFNHPLSRDLAVIHHPSEGGNSLQKDTPSNDKNVASPSSDVKAMENNLIGGSSKAELALDSSGKTGVEDKKHNRIFDESVVLNLNEKVEHSKGTFVCLPDVIVSMKKTILEDVKEARVKPEHVNTSLDHEKSESANAIHSIPKTDPTKDLEADSDNEQHDTFKIEPTIAEEEALAKGLQTVKNSDLEEIRALGTGTYGAVYHGKWKGSDVAIKRIKASCFSGKPSERKRLIADFWKEASILGSLHHPNVVSFFGVVRDGPDGSLATVTEFMVNGSLKQFLHKKDRTIDRRKRLILAMDAAFGMEYLHEKNIVHFDLKCENLLVNMRDPHRPICKIGDLGLSKVKQRTLVSGGVRGTLPWMAPELLSGKTNMVTEKIDVYSFGIVMWELLTAEEPYADMNCAEIIGGIVNNKLRPQIPCWCDPEWKSLMESCWVSDPKERPSFADISQKLRKMSAAINIK